MTDCNHIISSYISYRRNIKDMPFVKTMTDTELAIGVSRSLSEIFGDELEFRSLKNIPLTDCLKLKQQGVLTNEIIDNKDISAYGANTDLSKIVLINEQDHIRIIAKTEGFDLEKCFKIANQMDDLVLEKLEMSFDVNYGYLTSNPKMMGTGMEIGVVMFLPAILKNKAYIKLKKEILGEDYVMLCTNGLPWDEKSPFVLFKNRYTFGNKENEFAEKMQNLITKIKQIEILEENKIFDFSASGLTDLIFRSYGIATNCYRLSYAEAEEKIGNILWGNRLKMLKCSKQANLFGFLNSIKDDCLDETLSVKEKEKLRAKLVCSYVLKNVSKGEVDV